ncbi:hypothetical protein BV898_11807 [Hypsibius exemplaris]|uniref:Uncharacterized protein n=1 Tax=Hypsibius exemplaris TaxID=2072580 RepID=A0A1W0WFP6_HYPEX|nr:hypothetical protein BV898_11807 [Hypsibius exemplaris]
MEPDSGNLRAAVVRNLECLTDYERNRIKQVLMRDEQLQRVHSQRVNTLKVELDDLRRNQEAKADSLAASYTCTVCEKELHRFFSKKAACAGCFRVVCLACVQVVDGPPKQSFCRLCTKGWQIWQTSGEWMEVERREGISASPMAAFILREGLRHTLSADDLGHMDVRGSQNATREAADEVAPRKHRKLHRGQDGLDGDAQFLRRSLHINAEIPIELHSEYSVLSPLKKNLTKMEDRIISGLRRHTKSDAFLFSHSAAAVASELLEQTFLNADGATGVNSESKRPIQNTRTNAIPVGSSLPVHTDASAIVEFKPIGHDIETAPRHPSKRLKPEGNIPMGKSMFNPPPMLVSDPQLRIAFNYDDGQLEVYIMRCRNLPLSSRKKEKPVMLNPYVKVHLRATKGVVDMKRKTKTVFGTTQPEYDAVLKFPVDRAGLADNWNLHISVCAKKGLFQLTSVLEETSMVVTENYLTMTYPIWIHFHGSHQYH